jgi:hypothetical protein
MTYGATHPQKIAPFHADFSLLALFLLVFVLEIVFKLVFKKLPLFTQIFHH